MVTMFFTPFLLFSAVVAFILFDKISLTNKITGIFFNFNIIKIKKISLKN